MKIIAEEMKAFIVLTTVKNITEADTISAALIAKRLIACCNVTQVKSSFLWKGKVDNEDEQLLIMKTIENKLTDLEKEVKSLHSYEVPEIVGFPLEFVSKDYFDWLISSTQ
jgi:periplasmic divalent cation tolerance protein